jgi:hypothetical protein
MLSLPTRRTPQEGLFALNNDQMAEALASPDVIKNKNAETFKDKLWLLEGSPLLHEFESEIARAFGEVKGKASTVKFGIFAYLMNKLVQQHRFDFVLLDVSPSNSALNQAAALSCDYILPPCTAGLYSCGSIYGLLSSVLTGPTGWLVKHSEIANKQWGRDSRDPLDYRLPKRPPKLLPILVNNYACTNKPAAIDDDRLVNFSDSQFVYTISQYVNEDCPFIVGSTVEPNADWEGQKVEFEPNLMRKVIPFISHSEHAIPAGEEMGRPMVELTKEHFIDFYGEDTVSLIAQRTQTQSPTKDHGHNGGSQQQHGKGKGKGKGRLPAANARKRGRSTPESPPGPASSSGADMQGDKLLDKLVWESQYLANRFTTLATWLASGETQPTRRDAIVVGRAALLR